MWSTRLALFLTDTTLVRGRVSAEECLWAETAHIGCEVIHTHSRRFRAQNTIPRRVNKLTICGLASRHAGPNLSCGQEIEYNPHLQALYPMTSTPAHPPDAALDRTGRRKSCTYKKGDTN
jgi:hypothetical protein